MGRLPYPVQTGRVAYISRDDLARASAGALHQGGHSGCVYELTGPEAMSMTCLAASLTAVTGAPITFDPVSEAEFAAVCRTAYQMPKSPSSTPCIAPWTTGSSNRRPGMRSCSRGCPRTAWRRTWPSLSGRFSQNRARNKGENPARVRHLAKGSRPGRSSGAQPPRLEPLLERARPEACAIRTISREITFSGRIVRQAEAFGGGGSGSW